MQIEVLSRPVQLQILGAQGPLGFKGDPGANTMAVGLFTNLSGLNIPLGTDRIQTSGFGAVGIGAAQYMALNTPPVGIAVGPMTAQTLNGRWFQLDPGDSPLRMDQLGAPGDGTNVDALFRAALATGRDILFGQGSFGVTPPYALQVGQSVRGIGKGRTTLVPVSAVAADLFAFPADAGAVFGSVIADMTIQADGMVDGRIFTFGQTHYPTIQDVAVNNGPALLYSAAATLAVLRKVSTTGMRGSCLGYNGVPYLAFQDGRTLAGNVFVVEDCQFGANPNLRPNCWIADGNTAALHIIGHLGSLGMRSLFVLRNSAASLITPAYWRINEASTDYCTGSYALIEAGTDIRMKGVYAHADAPVNNFVDGVLLDDHQSMSLSLLAAGSAASPSLTGLSQLALVTKGMVAANVAYIGGTVLNVDTVNGIVTLDTPSTGANPSAYVDFSTTQAGATVTAGSATVQVTDSSVYRQGQTIWGQGLASGSRVKQIVDATHILLTKAALTTPGAAVTLTFGCTLICASAQGSPLLTNFVATERLAKNMGVSGLNIPAGATIASVDSANGITLSVSPTGPVGAITITGVATNHIQFISLKEGRAKGFGHSALRNETGFKVYWEVDTATCSRQQQGQWPGVVAGPASVSTMIGPCTIGKEQNLNPFMSEGVEIQAGATTVTCHADLSGNVNGEFLDQTGGAQWNYYPAGGLGGSAATPMKADFSNALLTNTPALHSVGQGLVAAGGVAGS